MHSVIADHITISSYENGPPTTSACDAADAGEISAFNLGGIQQGQRLGPPRLAAIEIQARQRCMFLHLHHNIQTSS